MKTKKISVLGIVIIIAIIVIDGLSSGIALIFLNRVAGSIAKLADYSQSIAAGNLLVENTNVKSRDEVLILARQFRL